MVRFEDLLGSGIRIDGGSLSLCPTWYDSDQHIMRSRRRILGDKNLNFQEKSERGVSNMDVPDSLYVRSSKHLPLLGMVTVF